MFAKIHHDYNHYITIEFLVIVFSAILDIHKSSKKILSQINSSLQYSVLVQQFTEGRQLQLW